MRGSFLWAFRNALRDAAIPHCASRVNTSIKWGRHIISMQAIASIACCRDLTLPAFSINWSLFDMEDFVRTFFAGFISKCTREFYINPNTCLTLPRTRSDAMCLLDLSDTTATEPNGSQCPCALLSMKSCSVRLTSMAVRRGHFLLPAQLMHCCQLVDILLPLLDNAHSTRLLGCFQRVPLFMIWAAATRTLLF